ncbi:hypothetical protein ACFSHQ_24740 [Gemmobacter lanyuensis]
MVFSGTLVVRGTGRAEVTATGAATEIGKIGTSLATIGTESPRLYVQTRRIVAIFAIAGTGSACWWAGFMPICGATGWRRFLRGSPSACRCSPRNFLWYWPFSWRWAPGDCHVRGSSRVGQPPSKHWARQLSCAATRPAP